MNIVFKIFPSSSHLNATYKFAHELKNRNYNVIYAGIREYEKEVLVQGFKYFIDKDVFPQFIPSSKKSSLIQRIKNRSFLNTLHTDYLKGDGFDSIIENLKPNLIIVDSPYVRNAIALYDKKTPFVIFESMVALNRRPFHPPLNIAITPKSNLYYKLISDLAWKKYFLTSFFERAVLGAFFPSKHKIKTLAKSVGFPNSEIDFDRYFHIGLKNIPELIASPYEFDFPHTKLKNQYYIGSPTNMTREESSYDHKYLQVEDQIKGIEIFNKSCNNNDRIKIVYCSFGSMAWRYKGVKDFYDKLINIALNDDKIQLYVSIGYEMKYWLFRDLPKNIVIFRKVPQLDLLKKVDMMITHGGINTIIECILSGVPMLVYPGTSKIDQVGNACRVNFHELGLMGTLNESEKTLRRKIYNILNNGIYKQNLTKMKKALLNTDSSDGLKLIDSLLIDSHK